MSNLYLTLKQKHSEDVNGFPMFFAFSDKQFNEALEKWGIPRKKASEALTRIPGGGFVRKEDGPKLLNMLNRHEQEMKDAMNHEETGKTFIYEMFRYELANHEYGYTRDVEPTLDALGLTWDEVKNNPKLAAGLEKARMDLLKEDD